MRTIDCRSLVYVVGHSRGGTTWLGSLLRQHPAVRYIFEPFASQAQPYTGFETQSLFNNTRRYQQDKQEPRFEHPSPRFFNMDPDEPALSTYRNTAREHLRRLVSLRHGDVRDAVVILKQPRLENLGWVVGVLQPDRCLFVDRHPFGVINSYHRYAFWDWISLEYPLAAATASQQDPSLAVLFAEANDCFEQLLVLSHARAKVVGTYCSSRSLPVFSYEDLCLDPVQVMRKVCVWCDLEPTDDYLASVARSSRPEQRSDGYLDVNKNPLERMYGWRRELPPDVIDRLAAFVVRHGLPVPVPGAGLPELTKEERASGVAIETKRRAQENRLKRLAWLKGALWRLMGR